jgi:hypothetical protein
MPTVAEQLHELSRVVEMLARTLEVEDDRGKEDPRRDAFVARSVVDPGFRRRFFGDPERTWGRADAGIERLAHRLRELDEILGRIDDGLDLGGRDLS